MINNHQIDLKNTRQFIVIQVEMAEFIEKCWKEPQYRKKNKPGLDKIDPEEFINFAAQDRIAMATERC